jgi:hypothetical protein
MFLQEACTAAEYQAQYLQQRLEVAEEHLEEMDDQLQAEQVKPLAQACLVPSKLCQ